MPHIITYKVNLEVNYMNNKIFLKEVGSRLKRKRKELGYTQAQLVEIINKDKIVEDDDYLSDKQMSRVESGHNYTRLDKFVAWCLALGKTPDYFLLGIDNGNDEKSDKIAQINGYLQLCNNETIDNILILVKAMYENNK